MKVILDNLIQEWKIMLLQIPLGEKKEKKTVKWAENCLLPIL